MVMFWIGEISDSEFSAAQDKLNPSLSTTPSMPTSLIKENGTDVKSTMVMFSLPHAPPTSITFGSWESEHNRRVCKIA
jgi:hypothetical protein